MALDTRYRPIKYADVLGQEAATSVLRQYVKEGKGFHQSYVFCGQHGSGKTTLGRILARALLCSAPVEGEPCDQCASCLVLLSGGTHECFEELDAASKSGKADLGKIVEDVTYSTFSGRRRIYLFDESHRLSKQALDVLLKPMEDSITGSEEKKLVVIFCTTEPEKMTSTIFSRCAPAFVIRTVAPEIIASRLAFVCQEEKIEFELEALVTIAEVSECHIRDALKTVEGVSMLGPITRASVFGYLQLGANDLSLDLLLALGTDLPKAIELSSRLAVDVSPSAAYERLAEASMCAYRAHLSVGKVPTQWNQVKVKTLAERGAALLGIAARFAAPPHRPTRHTLILDVGTTHHILASGVKPAKMAGLVLEFTPSASSEASPPPEVETFAPVVKLEVPVEAKKVPPPVPPVKSAGTLTPNVKEACITDGVWIDPRAIGRGSAPLPVDPAQEEFLSVVVFRDLVNHHLRDLKRGRQGRTG